MARISGINIPSEKKIFISLTYIHGIGRHTALEICKKAGVSPDARTHSLPEDDLVKIRNAVSEYTVEGALKATVGLHIKRLMAIKSYRGFRHTQKLPVRGQRTKSNARTRKGKKRVAIPGKKMVSK